MPIKAMSTRRNSGFKLLLAFRRLSGRGFAKSRYLRINKAKSFECCRAPGLLTGRTLWLAGAIENQEEQQQHDNHGHDGGIEDIKRMIFLE